MSVKRGSVRWHEKLPLELEKRVRALYAIVKEFGTTDSEEGWVDGFCYDMHPDKEVKIWEEYAGAYYRAAQGKSREKRKELWVLAVTEMCKIPLVYLDHNPSPQEVADMKVQAQARLIPAVPKAVGVGSGKSTLRAWASLNAELKKQRESN